MSDNTFDYIVIGGGTAGALMCNRLTRKSQQRTLLIEAGRKDDYHWIHIPVGYLYCINNPRTDWMYRTREEPGLNGRALIYPRGRVLGAISFGALALTFGVFVVMLVLIAVLSIAAGFREALELYFEDSPVPEVDVNDV